MKHFAGIDIGSTAIKVALVDPAGRLAGTHVCASGSLFHRNARDALQALLARLGLPRQQVGYLMATGYGRKLFKEADDCVSEITANAAGAYAAAPGVGTVINIGGQDSKAIRLDARGGVGEFVMNDKCAAGTGRFLDVAARNLGIDLEELGDCHLAGTGAPLAINSTCTVFAESEIVGLLAAGHAREEIVAGIHYAIARRTARLARRVGLAGRVLFDGGPALNRGLVAALQDELGQELVVPADPQGTTAWGAALLAREAWLAEQAAA